MTEQALRHEQHYWHHPCFDDLALFSARFVSQRYALHTHPTYVIALITAGCEKIRIDRTSVLAPVGAIAIVHPEEWHDGEKGIDDGWSYRTFYPSIALMEVVARELGRRSAPVFSQRVIIDPQLAANLGQAHAHASGDDRLAAEVSLLCGLRDLIKRHADADGPAEDIVASRGRSRFDIYRQFIDARMHSNVTMQVLSSAAGVTRFQVIRDFKNVVGQTPSAYLRDQRVRRALTLMKIGQSSVEAAAGAGFADQSHLSRTFRAAYGVTPGQFKHACSKGTKT